jgi:hypothetical protein
VHAVDANGTQQKVTDAAFAVIDPESQAIVVSVSSGIETPGHEYAVALPWHGAVPGGVGGGSVAHVAKVGAV